MFKKLLGFPGKKVYKSFLVSYISIFMLSIVICLGLFSITLTSAGKMYAKTGLLSVSQFRNIMDTRFNNLNAVARTFLSQERIYTIKSYSWPYNAWQTYNMKLLHDQLREEVSKNELIKELYIHFDNSDCVLSSQNIYHGDEFAGTVQNDLLIDYDTFLSQLVFNDIQKTYSAKRGYDRQIYFMRKLTISRPGQPSKATLIIKLDMDAFAGIISKLSSEHNCEVAIDAGDEGLVYGNLPGSNAFVIDEKDTESSVYVKALLSGKPITFICKSGAANNDSNYYFTLALDNTAIINSIRLLAFCFALTVLVGIVLCHVLAKKQYTPVENIMSTLDATADSENTDKNEYSVINDHIEKLRNLSEKADRYSEKYYKLYRKKILTDLLLGDNIDIIKNMIREDEKLLPLQSDCFMVLGLFTTKLPESPVKYGGINHMEMLQQSVTDMISDYFADTAFVYSATLNRVLYIVINPFEDLDDVSKTAMYTELYEIINEIRDYIIESLGMSVSAAVSNLRHSLKHINDAYLETEEVRQCIIKNPHSSPILCYHTLKDSEGENSDSESRDDDIVKYVNENYTDPDLCLKSIAAKFNLSMPYVSRLFKKQTGSGLSDYIHLLRLDMAKKLLVKDKTLNEIADYCGYTNALTLIRAFKRYEGVTPTEYKNRFKTAI